MVQEPFVFGREVTDAELVDREEELTELINVMRGGRRHFLIGPRRFGKTSLLTVAANRVRELGNPVVLVNAQQYSSEEGLASEIVAQAAKQSGFSLRDVSGKIAELFSRLRPMLSFDPIKDSWAVKLALDPSDDSTALVTDALDGLDELARVRDRRITLVIDEFQELSRRGGLNAEARLRAVVQRHRHLSYVFAGSDESMLIAMTSEHDRPFYRLGSRRFLGPVPRADFSTHLRNGFERTGATITPEAIVEILDLAKDVPYSVQRLALSCWQLVRNRQGAGATSVVISPADVAAELDQLLRLEAPVYSQFFTQLTPIQLRALKWASANDAKAFSRQAVAKRLGIGATTLKRALESLVSKTHLRRIYDGDPSLRYTFEDPFFGAYVSRFIHA